MTTTTTTRGGKRQGAGRPSGSNHYGEPTKAIRIPLSRLPEIKIWLKEAKPFKVPLYGNRVQAGFPSPAEEFIESHLDLNTHLIRHPAATFFVSVTGDSMINAGIHPGDMLVVDKSLKPSHGKIVIAAIDGELTVKRLSCTGNKVQLLPENEGYPPIDISNEQDMVIWGVVTFVIHQAG